MTMMEAHADALRIANIKLQSETMKLKLVLEMMLIVADNIDNGMNNPEIMKTCAADLRTSAEIIGNQAQEDPAHKIITGG